MEPLENDRRKVTFADVADLAISKNNFPDKYKTEEAQKKEEEAQLIKSLIRSIYEEAPKIKEREQNPSVYHFQSKNDQK